MRLSIHRQLHFTLFRLATALVLVQTISTVGYGQTAESLRHADRTGQPLSEPSLVRQQTPAARSTFPRSADSNSQWIHPTATSGSGSAPTLNVRPASGQAVSSNPNGRSPAIATGVVPAVASNKEPGNGAATQQRTPLRVTDDRSNKDSESSGGGSLLQSIVSVGSSLLIVVGLFLGVAWCYRKSLNSSVSSAIPNEVVNVLGRAPIAARQQLILVRFGPKLVLISMVQGEARTISEITDPLEVDRLAGCCESAKPHSITSSFRSVLAQGGAT